MAAVNKRDVAEDLVELARQNPPVYDNLVEHTRPCSTRQRTRECRYGVIHALPLLWFVGWLSNVPATC